LGAIRKCSGSGSLPLPRTAAIAISRNQLPAQRLALAKPRDLSVPLHGVQLQPHTAHEIGARDWIGGGRPDPRVRLFAAEERRKCCAIATFAVNSANVAIYGALV